MQLKTNIVTGGLGFIGNHLVRQLLQEGHKVVVIDDLSNADMSCKEEFHAYDSFSFIEHDISKPLPTIKAPISTVFNLAALVSVPDSFSEPLRTHQVNETGFINVLQFCHAHNVEKMVYASSCAVYGESANFPLKETECIIPSSPYGLTKLNNERYAAYFHQAHGLASTGLRFFNVFGPGQKADSAYAGVISIFMDRAMKGLPLNIYGDGNQIRDFVFVEDIVQALLKASNADENNVSVYNVGNGVETTINDLFSMIADITGYQEKPNYCEPRMGDVEKSLADPSSIKKQLGYQSKWNIREGLEALYQSLN